MSTAALIALLALAPAQPANDNNVFFDGLWHDTARPLYRPDGERVNAQDAVTVRLRSFQFDLTRVSVEAFDGSGWQSFPMRYDVDDPTCDGASLMFQCVQWLGAIPANPAFTQYRFLVEDGTDRQLVGAAATGTGSTVFETNASDFRPFPLPAPTTGKRIHVRAEGSTQTLETADATCGVVAGGYTMAALSGPVNGWRTATINASPGARIAFRITVDGQARTLDRLGRPWSSAYDEVWLDRGLTYDVNPDSVMRQLVDAHTHPIDSAQSGAFNSDILTGVLDGNGVQLGLTSLNGSEGGIKGMADSRPDRFRGMTWALPTSDATARAMDLMRVESDLATRGFVGIKFHPVEQSFAADAAFVDPYLDLAEKYRVPVVIHTEQDSGANPPDAASPARVANLALRHPGVVVIMYHWDIAQCDRTNVLIEALRAPNVLVETSWSNARQIRLAMCTLGAQRVMFGTDATTDGANHYNLMNIRTESCGMAYESYNSVIATMRGSSPYVALSSDELNSWQRDSAIVAFDLSLRPVAPQNRPACTMPAPALTVQPFPASQNACLDFPGGPVDAGVPVTSMDAAMSRPDAAVTATDAAMNPVDAAMNPVDASMMTMPDAAMNPVDAAMNPVDASMMTARDASVTTDAAVTVRDAGTGSCTPGCVSDTERRVCTATGPTTLACTGGTTCVDGECRAVAVDEPEPQGPCSCETTRDDGAPAALALLAAFVMVRRRRR